jgi:hypothetical protein
VRNEINFFFHTGVPLGLSALFVWGAPPWFAMIMAGQTANSAHLQSALGMGRVFYNCTSLMVSLGPMFGYISAVIPGCIGAKRKDLPAPNAPDDTLQLFAGPIMHALGVSLDIHISHDVGVFCKLVVITNWLMAIEAHLECIFINLGYAQCATLNSLVNGLGVDVLATYFLIYKWDMGM